MTRKTLYTVVLFLMLWSHAAYGQEFRGGVSAGMKLFSKLEAEIEIEARKIFYPESYHSQIIQGGLDYSLTRAWNIGLMYNHAFVATHTENKEGKEGDENSERDKFAVDLGFRTGRFGNDMRLTNRFRYQYTINDDAKPKEYLRNKITLDYRMTKKMNPYIAIEPYYNLRKNAFNVTRFYLGNEMPFFGSNLEIYYIAEVNMKKENIFVQYIVGISFKIKFE